jgi:hypothetical protein
MRTGHRNRVADVADPKPAGAEGENLSAEVIGVAPGRPLFRGLMPLHRPNIQGLVSPFAWAAPIEGVWRPMSLGNLSPRGVATSLGELVFWSRPEIYDSAKPVVLVIAGMFSPADDFANLPDVLGLLGDGCIMRMPGSGAPLLSRDGVRSVATAVEEAIAAVFGGRPVVLLGVSIGAVVALSVRAQNVVRVLAVEPMLATGALWPIVEPLRASLGPHPDPSVARSLLELYGISPDAHQNRDYLDVLQDLTCPVDVVLGEEPLQPPRAVTRFPSLVGEPERRLLAAAPNVKLHLAPGAGHNILGQSPKVLQAALMEACRRASAWQTFDAREVDEPLLDATPLTARRLLYWGAHGERFREALLRADPKALVDTWRADHPEDDRATGGFDAVVAAGPPSADRLAQLAERLETGGHLIARWSGSPEELAPILAPHALFLREPVDAAGTGVLRAQKCTPGGRPKAALHLHTVAYASLLMDIRTRLPARALASDPDLDVLYDTPPAPFRPLPLETPKFMILQRTGDAQVEAWRPALARAIKTGHMMILEYDDHPLLVAEVLGRPVIEDEMRRFAYAHAVQTSTPPLIDVFRRYNPEVAVFPNAAFDLAPFPEGERRRRVFYGGVLRGDYAVAVARSLGDAVARFPDTEFVVIGDREVFDALPTQAKEYYEYMPFEAYLRLMAECSISLSPLAPLPLRETKSDAKFIDASRSGALTIASPTVYDRVIEHGVNGLLARDIADWSPLLIQALGDQNLRRTLSRRAWAYVRDERMFADQIAVRRAWYQDLWARREALNEALMDRVPGLRDLVSA